MDTLIVGRVAVRVVPDTGNFRDELKADLKAKTSGIDAEVPVDATLNAEDLESRLQAKAKELSDKLRIDVGTRLKNTLNRQVRVATRAAELQSKADPISFTADGDGVVNAVTRGLREAISRRVASGINEAIRKGVRVDGRSVDRMVMQVEASFGDMEVRPKLGDSFLSEARHARGILESQAEKVRWFDGQAIDREVAARVGRHLVTVPVKFDGSSDDFQRQLKRSVADATSGDRGMFSDLSQKITRPVSDALFNLRRKLAFILTDLKAVVKTDVSEPALLRSEIELEMWFKRLKILTSEIKVVLNKKSVHGVMAAVAALSGGRLFKKLVSLEPLKNLDTQLPKIALMTTLIGQSVNLITSMVAGTLSLGRSIAQIIPLALALPGAFAAAGVAIYSMVAPLREFNKRIPDMGVGLKAMQAQMTTAFWSKAHAGLSSLTLLLPVLTRGFARVGSAAGAFIGALALESVKRVGPTLTPFFTSVAKSFGIFTKVAPSMAQIIAGFVKLGTHYVPILTEALGGQIKRLDSWLTRAIASGEAFNWIDNALVQFRNLGQVIAGAYRVMKGLSKAAADAGAMTLGSLAASLDHMQKVINEPDFQRRLTNIFASARAAVQAMVAQSTPAINALFRTIGDGADRLLPKIGLAAGQMLQMFANLLNSDAVGGGLVYFFDSLNTTLANLQPSIKFVSIGLGGLLKTIGVMLTSFEPIVEISFGALQAHADGLLKSVQNVVKILGAAFANALRQLMPAVEKLAPAMLDIAESLARAASQVLTAIGPALAALLGLIANVAVAFSNLPGFVQAALVAFVAFKAIAAGGWAQLVTAGIAGLITKVSALRASFLSTIPAINAATTRAGAFVGTLKSIAAKALIAGLAVGTIVSAMQRPIGANEMELAVNKLAAADLSGVNAQVKDLWGTLPGTTKQVSDLSFAFQGFRRDNNWFWNGADAITGFFSGGAIRSGVGKFSDELKALDSQLASLQNVDSAKAAAAFEQIKAQATLAGYSVDELRALFPEYSSAVELASGQASGAFAKSSEQIKQDAQDIQDKVFAAFEKMDSRVAVLSGKAKVAEAKSLVTSRAAMLTQIKATASASDQAIIAAAQKLNNKIAAATAALGSAQGKSAKEKASKELDDLLAEYQSKFGNLPSLLNTDQASLSSAISQMVGNGLNTSDQQKIADSIQAPVDRAIGDVKSKLTQMQADVAAMDIGGRVSGMMAAAVPLITNGFASLKIAVNTEMLGLAQSVASAATQMLSPIGPAMAATISSAVSALDGLGPAAAIRASVSMTASTPAIRSAVSISLLAEGKSVAQSFVDGLLSKLPEVIDAAKRLGKAAKDNKGPISYDRVMLIPEGRATVDGYITGLTDRIPKLKAAAGDLTRVMESVSFSSESSQRGREFARAAVASATATTASTVYQIGDVTVDVSELSGLKDINEIAKYLRRKKRQAGGK